ncbi:MAG: hypothetical protein LiPW15_178 [Parcubacteria group bacterium LiPW_15]|nr:MAG: hypothetical protein LiPW15_178 [Parcubacteria group bacterium LiPW_15]
MSYKKRKIKKSRLNRLKYKFVQIKSVLLGRSGALLQWKEKKTMRLKQTQIIMAALRMQNKLVRANNKKIDEWADDYVNDCILNGRPVQILTQWCVAKDLEERLKAQGGEFSPIKTELELIQELIPKIIGLFSGNGATVNWWITLNRSYIDTGRVCPNVEAQYKTMLSAQIDKSPAAGSIILLDWEEEVLGGRPVAAKEVQANTSKFVSPSAFEIDFERHAAWVREDSGLDLTDADIRKDLAFKIACEAEEGRFLLSPESPFPNGEFLLASLEQTERYVFFSILALDFRKRLLPILKPNPWRL